MSFLRGIVHRVFFWLHRHFSENRASRWQVALLMVFFVCLCWFKGVLAGLVAAFFVFYATPDGPSRAWPAAITFFGIVFAFGIFGTVKAWQMYKAKVAEISPLS